MLHINTVLSMLLLLRVCRERERDRERDRDATLAPAARLLVCCTGSLQLEIANNVAEPFWALRATQADQVAGQALRCHLSSQEEILLS